jgi:methionine aminopeptidase
VLTYHDEPPDQRIQADDVVYLDLGPVFNAWEADFGRTFVLGDDARKRSGCGHHHAFRRGTAGPDSPTAGALYDS